MKKPSLNIKKLVEGGPSNSDVVELEQKIVKELDLSENKIDEFRAEQCLFEELTLNQAEISEGRLSIVFLVNVVLLVLS